MRILRILLVVFLAVTAPVAFAQLPNSGLESAVGAPPQNESLKSVRLYPNPSIEYLQVKFETPIARLVKLNVHNIIGSEMPLESEVIDDYQLNVRVKDYTAGVYLLSIRNGESGQKSAFKFLKK